MLNPNVGPVLPLAVQDEARALTFRFFLHYTRPEALAPFLGAVAVVHGDDPGDSAPPTLSAGGDGDDGDTDSVSSMDSLAVFESLPSALLDTFADEVSAHVLDIRAEAPAVHYVRAMQCMRSMRLSPRASNRVQSAIHALTAPGGACAECSKDRVRNAHAPPVPLLLAPCPGPYFPPGGVRRAARETYDELFPVRAAAAAGDPMPHGLTSLCTDGSPVPTRHPPRLPPAAPVLLARVGVALGAVAGHRVAGVGGAGAAAGAAARPRAAARRAPAGRARVREGKGTFGPRQQRGSIGPRHSDSYAYSRPSECGPTSQPSMAIKSSHSVTLRCGQHRHHLRRSWNIGASLWCLQAASPFSSGL